jgi:hypothetical protein
MVNKKVPSRKNEPVKGWEEKINIARKRYFK